MNYNFEFIEEVALDNATYKVYGLKKLDNVVIMDETTFIPGKSTKPVTIIERVAICGDRVRKLPDMMEKGQTFECVSVEDGETTFTVNT